MDRGIPFVRSEVSGEYAGSRPAPRTLHAGKESGVHRWRWRRCQLLGALTSFLRL